VWPAPHDGVEQLEHLRLQHQRDSDPADGRRDRQFGMRDLGYQYVVVDDCWFNPNRDSSGNLQGDPSRFPSGMKASGTTCTVRA